LKDIYSGNDKGQINNSKVYDIDKW
jgi:hypothetical protein